jgi:Ser/Thr protein kinase RdoA (MazF antagonist)
MVRTFVQASYDLPLPITCRLLRRGFNDNFQVDAADHQPFVLRISQRRARGEADVSSETAFLTHLDSADIPVAAPVAARDGQSFAVMDFPEGPRPAVLFRHLNGRTPEVDSPGDARAQGVTLARIHNAAADLVPPGPSRYTLDLDHLLHRPSALILRLDGLSDKTRSTLSELVEALANAVQVRRADLTWTRCHGDCHGMNARIIAEGHHAGRAAFFDFDDGGPGYLAYDLAVFLWARLSFGRKEHAMWHHFIDAYRQYREITKADFEAAHIFVPIRHVWLMGEYAGRAADWGTELTPAAWIEKELAFLQEWQALRMQPQLIR